MGDVPFESWGLPLPFGELEGIYFTLPVFFFSDGFQAFPNNGFEQECWYTFSIHTSQHRMTNHD